VVEGPLRFVVGEVLLDEGQVVLEPLGFPQPARFCGFSLCRGLQAGDRLSDEVLAAS